MEFKDLELEAIQFKEAPTKTQLVNALRDIYKFLNRVGGAIIAEGTYSIADQPIGEMLNGAIRLKASSDLFEQGPNQSNLAVPLPPGHAGPRRV